MSSAACGARRRAGAMSTCCLCRPWWGWSRPAGLASAPAPTCSAAWCLPFVATKAITHGLVSADAAAPPGWCPRWRGGFGTWSCRATPRSPCATRGSRRGACCAMVPFASRRRAAMAAGAGSGTQPGGTGGLAGCAGSGRLVPPGCRGPGARTESRAGADLQRGTVQRRRDYCQLLRRAVVDARQPGRARLWRLHPDGGARWLRAPAGARRPPGAAGCGARGGRLSLGRARLLPGSWVSRSNYDVALGEAPECGRLLGVLEQSRAQAVPAAPRSWRWTRSAGAPPGRSRQWPRANDTARSRCRRTRDCCSRERTVSGA